jgi:hypothetical protein
MSTKTTFKRIALATVAALGFGVLTSVAPATAVPQTPSLISFGTPVSAAAGTTATIPVTFQLPAGFAIGDTIVVGARVITAPATSFATAKLATPGVSAVAATAADANKFTWAKAVSGSGSYHSGALSVTYNSTSNNWTAATTYLSATGDSTTSITLNLQITPDAAGTYGILAYAGTTAEAYDTAAELGADSLATATITGALGTAATSYATGTAATTATWTQVTSGAVTGAAATNGTIFKLALSNAAGASTLGIGENIVLSSSSSTVTFTALTGNLTNAGTTLSMANFVNGVAYIRAVNTAAASESTTFTATNGGLLAASISSAITTTWTAYSTQDAPTIAKSSTNTALTTTGAQAATTTQVNYLAASTATSHSLRVTLADNAAAFKTFVSVTDTNGKITGRGASTAYDQIVSLGAADEYASVSIPATLLLNEAVTVVVYSSTAAIKTATITGAVPATTTLTVTNSTRRAVAASANSILVRVTDQWGAAAANKTVTVTHAGRNSAIASTSLVSDATGYVTYTFTDAGTVGTVDTVTFASTGASNKTATINYAAYTVSTVTVEGPQTDDVAPTVTYSDINEASTGANTTVVTFTATVADAAGIGISGVPVTFTISGTGAAIRTNTVSRVTDALGEATTSVYGWVAGTYTITATAGAKTGTATVSFRQDTPASARSIAATVEGNVVKALVKDRFGNPVANVPLFASRSGAGYFGTGGSTASATTGLDGTAEFIINGGAATVSVGFGSTSFVLDYGQTSDVAGKVNATTATATTAGTAITAETGVGASFADAGVNKATVEVNAVDAASAAADAAAEATDAANAATDAANAAAEAADAATAAAQDAADAVAALSTQVATYISNLRKQITALTNLVIKIQKKVRA